MSDLLNILWRQQPNADGWDVAPDAVIWISVGALDAAWCESDDYVGHGAATSPHIGRYERFGDFFVGASFIFMPTVSFDDKGEVGFTNGRHRFAWLRDRGLRSLPIEVPPDQVAAFEARFGTVERIGCVL
ncbi:MAG TPA: hypothetical protein VF573_14470 [Paraburkholderia sp.]|uniref:hypothetical protein n=1 Tax=Paraburkholderia sp. TaxID=1926495 RepID=UPI002ECFE8FF